MHLYVDNTVISVDARKPDELESKLKKCLPDANKWMEKNHLMLNSDKTKYMTFGTTHTLNMVSEADLSVSLDGQIIEQVDHFKYLGVHLNPRLSFKNHAKYVKRKATCRMCMLGCTRKLVCKETSLQVYKSLKVPVLDYGDVVYDSLCARDSHMLQKIQNCLRIILQWDSIMHIVDMHKELNMTYLADRKHSHTLNQVYKCTNELSPA